MVEDSSLFLHFSCRARGLLTTPFHNMALCCPTTTAAGSTSKFYLVVNDLVGPQLPGAECTDFMLLIAAEEGVPTELAATAAFQDLRYRGVYSATLVTEIE